MSGALNTPLSREKRATPHLSETAVADNNVASPRALPASSDTATSSPYGPGNMAKSVVVTALPAKIVTVRTVRVVLRTSQAYPSLPKTCPTPPMPRTHDASVPENPRPSSTEPCSPQSRKSTPTTP